MICYANDGKHQFYLNKKLIFLKNIHTLKEHFQINMQF